MINDQNITFGLILVHSYCCIWSASCYLWQMLFVCHKIL